MRMLRTWTRSSRSRGRGRGCSDRGCGEWEGAPARASSGVRTYTEVEPGAVAWPFHWHAANEEAIIVVSGHGTMRLGDVSVEVRPGDYITAPAGVPHHLPNTGTMPLAYWCVPTMIDPEIAGYPDSGKLGAMTRLAPTGPLRKLFPSDEDGLGYFDADPLAKEGAKL